MATISMVTVSMAMVSFARLGLINTTWNVHRSYPVAGAVETPRFNQGEKVEITNHDRGHVY